MSLAGLAALLFRGLVEGEHLWLVLALVPAGFLGKILGTSLLKRTSERAFRVISLGVVILTGALGVATALWALW
jgi:uncharacterized protein